MWRLPRTGGSRWPGHEGRLPTASNRGRPRPGRVSRTHRPSTGIVVRRVHDVVAPTRGHFSKLAVETVERDDLPGAADERSLPTIDSQPRNSRRPPPSARHRPAFPRPPWTRRSRPPVGTFPASHEGGLYLLLFSRFPCPPPPILSLLGIGLRPCSFDFYPFDCCVEQLCVPRRIHALPLPCIALANSDGIPATFLSTSSAVPEVPFLSPRDFSPPYPLAPPLFTSPFSARISPESIRPLTLDGSLTATGRMLRSRRLSLRRWHFPASPIPLCLVLSRDRLLHSLLHTHDRLRASRFRTVPAVPSCSRAHDALLVGGTGRLKSPNTAWSSADIHVHVRSYCIPCRN